VLVTDTYVGIRRPDSVYFALILWVTAAGLTALIAVIGLLGVVGRARSVDWGSVTAGAVLLAGVGLVTIWQFNRGRPVARVALAGFAVFYTWGLVLDLTVVMAGKSAAPVIVVVIEAVRTGCAVVATLLSFSATARDYFAAYDAYATRSDATRVPAWLWAVGIAAVAAQLVIGFVDNLPSNGRSWTSWAASRSGLAVLQASMVLCLIPAYAILVRQFRFGRQWARVTLIVIGVVCGVLAVAGIVDTFDARDPSETAVAYSVLGFVQLIALLGAVVLSFRPAVNDDFRR
jgi:hypothetical protein